MVVSGLDVVALGALVGASGAIGEAGLALAFGLGGCLLSEVLPVFGESLCPVGCRPGHGFYACVDSSFYVLSLWGFCQAIRAAICAGW